MTEARRKKELREVIALTIMLVLGITIIFCNMFKITPGYNNEIACVITDIISYGFFIGGVITIMSIVSLKEIIDGKELQ